MSNQAWVYEAGIRAWWPLRNDPHNFPVIRARIRVLIERLRATRRPA